MTDTRVLQHQYGIRQLAETSRTLSTKNILICTGLYGYDHATKVGFLCHFDHPWSAADISQLTAYLQRNFPGSTQFECGWIGGKGWFWSPITRRKLLDHMRNQPIYKRVTQHDYDNLPWRAVDVTLCLESGAIWIAQLEGRSHPHGFFWPLKPMLMV